MVDPVRRGADGSGVPTIRDLIRESLAAGKSVRDLEADSGFQVKFQTFQELSNSAPKQFPKKAETVLGMAKALQVSEAAVVLAYAAGLGIPVSARSEFALRLPAGVDAIDGTMQKALISVVRAALAQGAADGMETTTEPDAPSQADADEKTRQRDAARKAGSAAIRPRINGGSLTSNEPGPGHAAPQRIDFAHAGADDILPMVASPEGGTFTVADLEEQVGRMTDAELVAAHDNDPAGYLAQWVQARRPELLEQKDYDLANRRGQGKSRGQLIREQQDDEAERP